MNWLASESGLQNCLSNFSRSPSALLNKKWTITRKLKIEQKISRFKNSDQNIAHLLRLTSFLTFFWSVKIVGKKIDCVHMKMWTQLLLKFTISQKLRVAQKKLWMKKIIVRSIRIFSVNLVIFEENFNFLHIYPDFLDGNNSKTRYDFFITSLVSIHCASFL